MSSTPIQRSRDQKDTESEEPEEKKSWKKAIEKKRKELEEIRRTVDAMVASGEIDLSAVEPLTVDDLLDMTCPSRSYHYCTLCNKTVKGIFFNHLNSAHKMKGIDHKAKRDALSALSAGVMNNKKGLIVDMKDFKDHWSPKKIHRKYWKLLEKYGVPVLNKEHSIGKRRNQPSPTRDEADQIADNIATDENEIDDTVVIPSPDVTEEIEEIHVAVGIPNEGQRKRGQGQRKRDVELPTKKPRDGRAPIRSISTNPPPSAAPTNEEQDENEIDDTVVIPSPDVTEEIEEIHVAVGIPNEGQRKRGQGQRKRDVELPTKKPRDGRAPIRSILTNPPPSAAPTNEEQDAMAPIRTRSPTPTAPAGAATAPIIEEQDAMAPIRTRSPTPTAPAGAATAPINEEQDAMAPIRTRSPTPTAPAGAATAPIIEEQDAMAPIRTRSPTPTAPAGAVTAPINEEQDAMAPIRTRSPTPTALAGAATAPINEEQDAMAPIRTRSPTPTAPAGAATAPINEEQVAEPAWTREQDMLIYVKYNDFKGDDANFPDTMTPHLPYSREQIAERFVFLLESYNKDWGTPDDENGPSTSTASSLLPILVLTTLYSDGRTEQLPGSPRTDADKHPAHRPTGTVEVLTFYPTMEEFSDFLGYLKKIAAVGAHQKCGICKVVPPPGWTPRPHGYNFKSIDKKKIENPFEEEIRPVKGQPGVYLKNMKTKKPISVSDFRKQAEEMCVTHDFKNAADPEEEFWSKVEVGKPLYGSDSDGTLYEKKVKEFNMNKLGTMFDKMEKKISGATTPFLYWGSAKTMFAFHTEDMDLYSINFLHFGEPKYWYGIAAEHAELFECHMRTMFAGSGYAKDCEAFWIHKNLVINPSVLRKLGIPFGTMIQRPQEFIITFPRGYHQGFNMGYNCAEAVNFADDPWIEFGLKAKSCSCPEGMETGFTVDMDKYVKKFRPSQNDDL